MVDGRVDRPWLLRTPMADITSESGTPSRSRANAISICRYDNSGASILDMDCFFRSVGSPEAGWKRENFGNLLFTEKPGSRTLRQSRETAGLDGWRSIRPRLIPSAIPRKRENKWLAVCQNNDMAARDHLFFRQPLARVHQKQFTRHC